MGNFCFSAFFSHFRLSACFPFYATPPDSQTFKWKLCKSTSGTLARTLANIKEVLVHMRQASPIFLKLHLSSPNFARRRTLFWLPKGRLCLAYPPPTGEIIAKIIRLHFNLASALGFLPNIPARAPKKFAGSYCSRNPFW